MTSMGQQQIIQCVGVNEEDTAHLRLLLRVVREELHDTWSWGTEVKANLVVVDPVRLIGEAAWRRANQRAVACAQVIGENDPKPPEGMFLRRPFTREAFVALLNLVSAGGPTPAQEEWRDEFRELDLGEVDLTALEIAVPGVFSYAPAEGSATAAAPTADAAVRTPIEFAPQAPAEVAISPSLAPISPTEQAVHREIEGIHGQGHRHIDPKSRHPLIFYLEKGVFTGPARIELPGVPALVLDPDEETFLARGLLRMLEPYASEPLRYSDWKLLTEPEWEHVRRTASARPYLRLKWMDSFIHSEGFLAKHLDPGANYRLNNRLDLAGDYPRAFRVATHMSIPRKLHEIARMSAVGLAEVFDVINAYESIGYVECVSADKARPHA